MNKNKTYRILLLLSYLSLVFISAAHHHIYFTDESTVNNSANQVNDYFGHEQGFCPVEHFSNSVLLYHFFNLNTKLQKQPDDFLFSYLSVNYHSFNSTYKNLRAPPQFL